MTHGTIPRMGDSAMRHGRQRPGPAVLECLPSRRFTVMDALPRPAAVITGYQRDSSSKRPWVSVVLARRRHGDEAVDPGEAVDAEERVHRFLENAARFPQGPPLLTVGHSISAVQSLHRTGHETASQAGSTTFARRFIHCSRAPRSPPRGRAGGAPVAEHPGHLVCSSACQAVCHGARYVKGRALHWLAAPGALIRARS